MRGSRTGTFLTVAVAFAAAAPMTVAAAASHPRPQAIKVGHGQNFRGFVNAKNSKATIRVLCAGPSSTGHPLARQTVRVARIIDPIARNDGLTGTAAASIGAWLTWPTKTAPPPPAYVATFTSYRTMPIPTGITVPCGGSGEMLFLPALGSRTVKAATVGLTFVNAGS